MANELIIMQCGHCGNKTAFEQHGEYAFEEVFPSGYQTEVTRWRLLKCLSCSGPTLQENSLLVGFLAKGLTTNKILYPSVNSTLQDIPASIDKRYQAALKVRNIEPSACAVLVGRTLEAVCNHENASGKTLADKINNLVNSDRIPKTLAEMATQLRQIRNLGAHDAEDEVTEEDVPIILDFLEAILEYLYVAPAKIEVVKRRLVMKETK